MVLHKLVATSITVIVNVNSKRTLLIMLKVMSIIPKPLVASNKITKFTFSWSFPNILKHGGTLSGPHYIFKKFCKLFIKPFWCKLSNWWCMYFQNVSYFYIQKYFSKWNTSNTLLMWIITRKVSQLKIKSTFARATSWSFSEEHFFN